MLKGKRVVVLGGTAGIGLAVAEAAARDGARVLVASSHEGRVREAVSKIPGGEGRTVDLRSEAAIGAFFEQIGALDHLVYTAGEELLLGPLSELDLTKARSFLEVRYWGALAAVKAAHTRMPIDGSIVLTSGTAGVKPHPGFLVGAGICAAMIGTARALAVELAPIRVNVVVPGFVRTDLWSNFPERAREEMFDAAAAKLPVRRIGTPADIAEHYMGFLRGGYVTGQSIIVDGGGVL